MSIKERQIIGMKYPNIAPDGYCCDKCHAHGVKLWCGDEAEGLDLSLTEFIPSSVKKLLCANCAEADQKVFMFKGWKSDYLLKINGGREIGHLFPALPAEGKDNLFYGDYEMPSYAILWWDRLPASKPFKKLRIVIGSPSECKLQAVKEACLELGLDCEVSGFKVESGQNEQPVGLSETTAGALTRAEKAQEKDYDAIAIGIESGIIRTGEPRFISIDLAVIVALFGDDMLIATSNGMQFVEEFVDIAEERGFKHTTVGDVIAEYLGGNKNDPHSFLSDEIVSRQETIKNGVKIIMSQVIKKWLNH